MEADEQQGQPCFALPLAHLGLQEAFLLFF